jgi:hypothetical protein
MLMKELNLVFVFALIFIASGCSKVEVTRVEPAAASPTATPPVVLAELVTPDRKGKKPLAFEEIDRVVAAVGKRNLRDVALHESDLEIRVWGGFGLTATQGFILNRTNNQWTALGIRPELREPRTSKFSLLPLQEPKQSWDRAWQLLLEQGLLTLPDAETINCTAMIEDGYSYVVEVRKGRSYRTYSYDNPGSQFENRCLQADNILNIVRILSADYGADF